MVHWRDVQKGLVLNRRDFTFGLGAAALGGFAASALPVLGQTMGGQLPPGADPTAVMLKPSQWRLVESTLARVQEHGFDPGEFTPPGMDRLLAAGDAQTRAQGGRMMIAGLLRYAKAVKVGRLPESAFIDDWSIHPPAFDPAPGFLQAVAQDQLAQWLASLPPPYAGYDSLRQTLADWRRLTAAADAPKIPAGKLSADTPSDPRLKLLRRRLAAFGYDVDVNGSGWDEGLNQAVTSFQRRHGYTPDAIVGPATLEALNISPQFRELQILANLERWRWLPPSLPADRVQVNIAAQILTLFERDQPVLSMRAVAGKPGNTTPMLSSMIHSVVLNPPWNVPGSIASNELWPKERANPGYLSRSGFSVVSDGAGGQRLVQRPSDSSALGQYKFDFDNNFAVYLHDTPTHGTFGRDNRLASHGCVRLEKPGELARVLLQGDPVWTPQAIEDRVAGNTTTRVPLQRQVAVYLLYWTAFAGSDGALNFRPDYYGWDELLMKKINALRSTPA